MATRSRDHRRPRDVPLAAPGSLPFKTDQSLEVTGDRDEANDKYLLDTDQAPDHMPFNRKHRSVGFQHVGFPEAVGRTNDKDSSRNDDQDIGSEAWGKPGLFMNRAIK
jgi:hypothetical protein